MRLLETTLGSSIEFDTRDADFGLTLNSELKDDRFFSTRACDSANDIRLVPAELAAARDVS